MGWFTRDEPVGFDAVIAGDEIWDAYTDDDGVLWLDTDEDVEVVIDGAIVDGVIYEAHVDRHGVLWIHFDDED